MNDETSQHFPCWFQQATSNEPYPFQIRFACEPTLPELVDVPTGRGKMAILATVRRRWEDSMSWNEEARISCRFSFKCPRLWDRLQPTAEEGVRHCHECDRDVHLALTEEAFIRHREADHCIAVPVLRPEREVDPDGPHYVVGRADPPYGPESEPRQ